MTLTYEYKMGTSQATLTLLSELGIPAPQHGFVFASKYVTLGDGSVQGNGWATDDWNWGFLTGSQRATIRVYVPEAGAHIFVRDLMDDGLTWADFEVEAEWPQHEDRQVGRRLGFTLKLRSMVELEDIE